MTLYLGKRQPGGLTKASPGDTLHIPFATYNDSGAPITDTGFHHSKIEIYKNNEPTARATDSGVWLGDSGLNYEVAGTRVAAASFEDTGQYANVTGLYSIGIRLFNTSDDTGFYDAGSTYHVAIQGLKIKSGQGHVSMNFFPAVFEIDGKRIQAGVYQQQGSAGFCQMDCKAIDGDTGPADNLGRISGDTGASSYIPQTVWREQNSAYTDTGSLGFGVNMHKLSGDTGAADHLRAAYDAQSTNSDTGLIANAAKMTFTVPGQVDANIQSVNDVTVTGTGAAGNEWGP